jgi:RecB family endonuclease NucS
VTGYCGTCRVHFTGLDGWVDHQHAERGVVCNCGRTFAVHQDFRKHVSAQFPEVHIIRSVA